MIFFILAIAGIGIAIFLNPNWNFIKHDLSILGARRSRTLAGGKKLKKSRYPEIFNFSMIFTSFGLLHLFILNHNFLFLITAIFAGGIGLIDVGTEQFVHVVIALIAFIGMVWISMQFYAQIIGYFLPVFSLTNLSLYIIPKAVGIRHRMSIYQKFFFFSFLFESIIYQSKL